MSTVFKTGDEVELIANTGGHNLPVGTKITLTTKHGICWRTKEYSTFNFNPADFKLLVKNRADIEREVAKARARLDDYVAKMECLNELEEDSVDQPVYKSWRLRQIITNNLPADQKVNAIENLFGDR